MGAKKSGRRRGAGGQGGPAGGTGESPGREGRGKRHTPEERRAAVEAFHKSGLTQKAFARQWDVSPVTLGAWVRKHAAEGPQGLERVASGPAKRRGRAPLPAPVREEVVAVHPRFPDFRAEEDPPLPGAVLGVAGDFPCRPSATTRERAMSAMGGDHLATKRPPVASVISRRRERQR